MEYPMRLIPLLLIAAAQALGAQRLSEVEQIAPTATVPVAQISRDSAAAGASAQVPLAGPVQPAAAPQATDRAESKEAPAQLVSGKPTADAGPALSDRLQGRPVGVERLGGKDRCDPARPPARLPKNCAAVIENRSADYAERRPELSPEQKLLLEQQLRDRDPNLRTTARRLAVTGSDEQSLQAQGIASVALRAGPADKREEQPALSQEQAAAIVGAIVNGANAPRN